MIISVHPRYLVSGISFVMLLSLLSSAQAFGPKPLTIALAIDMTGAKSGSEYQKSARLVIESILFRELKVGDTVTIYRVCDYTSTLASFKNRKLSHKTKVSRAKKLARDATKPCSGQGSTITKAIRMMHGNQISILFTDGGLGDDPGRGKFGPEVKRLVDKNLKALWVAGLSNQRAGQSSLRDSFVSKLPKDSRVITSGLNDAQSGFSQLVQVIKKARR